MTTRPGVARRRAWRWAVPLGGFALLSLLFAELGPARIVALFQTIGWNIVTVIALFGAHEAVLAVSLGQCLPPGHGVPFWRLLQVRLAGEATRAMTHGGPFLGEPAKAWVLSRQGVSGADAYGAAIAHFVANSTMSALVNATVLLSVLATASLGRPVTVLSHVLAWSSLVYATVAATAVVRRVFVIGAITRAVGRLPLVGSRFRADPARVRRLEDAILGVLRDRPATLARIVAIELAGQALLVLETYWVLTSMGLVASPWRAWSIEALTKTAGAIQFVGASEGGYALIFKWLGMAAAAGFTLSLVKRVRSLAVATLGLGALTLISSARSPVHDNVAPS